MPFHGRAVSFLAFKCSKFTKSAGFGSVLFFFCLLISLLPGTKHFSWCLEDIARDHQSKPEAAVTSAVPVWVREAWDAQKDASVCAALSPPHRGHRVTENNCWNEPVFCCLLIASSVHSWKIFSIASDIFPSPHIILWTAVPSLAFWQSFILGTYLVLKVALLLTECTNCLRKCWLLHILEN